MQMLFIILNREDLLDDIISAMIELEITGATILDGVGMERVLAEDVPIFAGLLRSISGSRSYNKNIVALIRQKDTIEELVALLKDSDIDFMDVGVGKMFSIPVDFYIGSEEVIE
ncbi:hypothetical protein H8E77_18700 [bacterium]|nr:hypothetical protein [bacterium]